MCNTTNTEVEEGAETHLAEGTEGYCSLTEELRIRPVDQVVEDGHTEIEPVVGHTGLAGRTDPALTDWTDSAAAARIALEAAARTDSVEVDHTDLETVDHTDSGVDLDLGHLGGKSALRL